MNSAPVDAKLQAFGFETVVINGHDFAEIEKAFATFHSTKAKPTCILLQTTKGKGVSFMQNDAAWHGKAPNDTEYSLAMAELQSEMLRLA